jgi:hypothetical protein
MAASICLRSSLRWLVTASNAGDLAKDVSICIRLSRCKFMASKSGCDPATDISSRRCFAVCPRTLVVTLAAMRVIVAAGSG